MTVLIFRIWHAIKLNPWLRRKRGSIIIHYASISAFIIELIAIVASTQYCPIERGLFNAIIFIVTFFAFLFGISTIPEMMEVRYIVEQGEKNDI